ncbi:uncharacterized protein N7498_002507 [Penicillium cinerascens]|uniref:Peptidase A1 domain-containing protein n=1 Tax=Penicillium cinerascens TaxID=70096 RepID=A0A9W9NA45_9EURO|nr:uncharacterized protein N7498_002507 [Penicillium cinerascens]KAJ5216100.1 hypothetical protein N7498_002507 [Penicillium cinerascens]
MNGIPDTVRSSILFILCHWFIFGRGITEATSAFPFTWSDKSFVPDGPWQAVSVGIGTPSQNVALYPGGRWASTILLSTICDNQTSWSSLTACYADDAGVFNRNKSISAGNNAPNSAGNGAWTDATLSGWASQSVFYDNFDIGLGSIVPNVSMTGLSDAYQTYPNGRNYPIEVGILSMGTPALTHIWGYTMMFIASYMYTSASRRTPSYSYGIHIGSAKLGIPGSAWLGGYDKNRIMGETSAQPFTPFNTNPGGNLVIGLQDIGLGVATGGSPWSYSQKSGLLSDSNSSLIAPVTVQLDLTRPYLYLPRSTCDNIASTLPVTFNAYLGLYFWNTNDDNYRTIVTSPAYLSFLFQKDSTNNQNITIKVPFALLNLTLEATLVTEETPYFPCYPSDNDYSLGRAFLQAAFVAENYGTGDGYGTWFLAQAPGPGLVDVSDQTNIQVSSSSIPATSNSWEVSWDSHWTALPSSTATSNSTNSTNSTTAGSGARTSGSSGLSQGAKIGIGVGCGLGGAVLICGLAWLFVIRRRRNQRQSAGVANSQFTGEVSGINNVQSYGWQYAPAELRGTDHDLSHAIPEAPGSLPQKHDQRYELF